MRIVFMWGVFRHCPPEQCSLVRGPACRRDRFIVRRLQDQGTTQQPAPSPVEGLPPIQILKRPKGRDPGGSVRMRPFI
jgi:hypothetical protein